ncbi:MAG: DUF4126 domain-containing protein [Magnetovibrionaceae bacterium]
MEALTTLALGLGTAWASGLNLYATVLVLGGLDLFGFIDLPPELEVISSFWVILAALGLYAVEFIADKIPGVDSLWDALHTFIRIPAGAFLAAGALGGTGLDFGLDTGFGLDTQMLSGDLGTILALLAGGTVAGASHLTKAGSRAAINTSPEPFSNMFASVVEDALVFGGLFLALFQPLVFVGLFVVFLLLAIWLLPKIWRGLRALFGYRESKVFGRPGMAAGPPPEDIQPDFPKLPRRDP